MKLQILSAFVLLCAGGLATVRGAVPEDAWRDAQVNAINRLPMHASFFAYADREEACQAVREDSENYLTLNGQWKFKWVRHSWQRPTGFWSAGFDDTDWDRIPVPGIWEMNGYGDPIYLNIGYAWRGNHSNNPPYVPEPISAPWHPTCICGSTENSWVTAKTAGWRRSSMSPDT